MTRERIAACLDLLRAADDMLMADGELVAASRLALVVDLLTARLDEAPAEPAAA